MDSALNFLCGALHKRFVVMMVERVIALLHQLEEGVRLFGLEI